ncbi:Calmodulin-like domain protein kinase [Mycena indigotica]|uniref:Calmodulin-like domain protein kinase n=1 Tax=Mycena indigotica TaxID=2126181 RepID=A0A8H6SYL3_9AGAR|nr:Calmodulin-like domain protein kinase [Mycena indigotica]KAF7307560.1 Calmodulin-like domain protein kinase [Mycena indigotica]
MWSIVPLAIVSRVFSRFCRSIALPSCVVTLGVLRVVVQRVATPPSPTLTATTTRTVTYILRFPLLLTLPPAPPPPPTKTFPVFIPGTVPLGYGLYNRPSGTSYLFFAFGFVSLGVVYATANRLGFAKTLGKNPTRGRDKLQTSVANLLKSFRVSCRATAEEVAACYNAYSAAVVGFPSSSKFRTLLDQTIQGRDKLRTIVLDVFHQVATYFEAYAAAIVGRRDIQYALRLLGLLLIYDHTNIFVVHDIAEAFCKWWLLLCRPDPGGAFQTAGKTYPFVPGHPSSWDDFLQYITLDEESFWGCANWKTLSYAGFVPTICHKQLQLVRPLGRGGFGEIVEGVTGTGKHVAVKRICKGDWVPRRSRRTPDGREQHQERKMVMEGFLREVIVSRLMMEHACFLDIYGVWHDTSYFYLAMEMGQSCISNLQIERLHTYSLGRQLINGVQALHKNGIVHRDIKPDNLLLNGEQLKIIDFGIAHIFDDASNVGFWVDLPGRESLQDKAGTPGYMSPLVEKQKPYAFDADLWSVGVTLFQWVRGEYVFPEFHPRGALKVGHKTLTPLEWDFFRRVFSVSPELRFNNWDEVLEHLMWDELLEAAR